MFEYATYDKLLTITKQEKPYRRTNHYPVFPDLRRQSHKRFYADKDGAFIVQYQKRDLIKVHKGNIVEFIQDKYWQGERYYLTSLCENGRGWYRQGYWSNGQLICNDEKRGGNVWVNVLDAEGHYMQMRPIRREIKYNMITNEPLVAYDIISPRVDRTKNVGITKKLNETFKLIETYFKAWGDKINDATAELVNEAKEKYDGVGSNGVFWSIDNLKLMYDNGEMDLMTAVIYDRSYRWYAYNSGGGANGNIEDILSHIKKEIKEYIWQWEYAYKESITPMEMVYIPTNDRLQVRLRGAK